jgi:hypothetical protein
MLRRGLDLGLFGLLVGVMTNEFNTGVSGRVSICGAEGGVGD